MNPNSCLTGSQDLLNSLNSVKDRLHSDTTLMTLANFSVLDNYIHSLVEYLY